MSQSGKKRYRYAQSLSFISRLPVVYRGWTASWLGSDDSAGTLAGRLGVRTHLPTVPWKRLIGPGKWILFAFLSAGGIVHEMRTSAVESWMFHYFSSRMTYALEAGPSRRIVFPDAGPFDAQRGYSKLPQFTSRLESEGFRIREQTQFSALMFFAAKLRISPPYRESDAAGLSIRSQAGIPLVNTTPSRNLFRTYEEIPPLIARSLIYIEDRALGRAPVDDRANPVLDWERLARAGLLYSGRKLGLPIHAEGGSTLATQIEKYRHSRYGATSSAMEKLRQITSATLRVYREGTDTRSRRREILLEYLNTMPLAAAPDYGEIQGLGAGLYAWFGSDLPQIAADLSEDAPLAARTSAYKRVLTLLCATRAPSYYLTQDRAALEARVDSYLRLLLDARVIDKSFADLVRKTPPSFALMAPIPMRGFDPSEKTANAIRAHLLRTLGVPSLYELDRLDLQAGTTIDADLQERTSELIERLKDGRFLAAHGLLGEHLLARGNPAAVNYAVLLFEREAAGNLLRIHLDNLDQPFDVNSGVKLQLGSTAKLRVLAHYLEILTSLYDQLSPLPRRTAREIAVRAKDPLTRWAATALSLGDVADIRNFLEKSLNRTYSASPNESFYTGGGVHHFVNFVADDNGRILTIREAFTRSVNLVFIRLMRDLVAYHEARLPYDFGAVLNDPNNPVRRRLLEEIADAETRKALEQVFRDYRDLSSEARISRLLGSRASDQRALTALWFAWHPGRRLEPEGPLVQWLRSRQEDIPADQVRRLVKAYGNPRLTLAEYSYLLRLPPLQVWCSGVLQQNNDISWNELLARSTDARRISSAWLFKNRNRHAQDLRLLNRIERDAFSRMTPAWQRLGFPFDRLVPSLATAIGSSSDRPAALAELVGIILNDGVRHPSIHLRDLRFGVGTPYETVFQPAPATSEQVLPKPAASILREALAAVVESGTAIRAKGALSLPDGKKVVVGAKTGSGDNRFDVFGPHGSLIDSRPVNRTATLVFYIGDRYFGVITAYVMGRKAAAYDFTSSLPAAILKLMAPGINARLAHEAKG